MTTTTTAAKWAKKLDHTDAIKLIIKSHAHFWNEKKKKEVPVVIDCKVSFTQQNCL